MFKKITRKFLKKPNRFYLFLLLSLFSVLVAGVFLRPEKKFSLSHGATCFRKPSFDAYPIESGDTYESASTVIDYSRIAEAKNYRSFIRTAAARGANFAGKYIVAEWGCGPDCQDHAIVNAKTGQVIAFGPRSAYGAEFYKNSRLIVFNPRNGIIKDLYSAPIAQTAYFVVENNQLVSVCD